MLIMPPEAAPRKILRADITVMVEAFFYLFIYLILTYPSPPCYGLNLFANSLVVEQPYLASIQQRPHGRLGKSSRNLISPILERV
jgi:hypothetical protein